MTTNDICAPDKSSFRDPSGTVFSRGGRLLRQVNLCYRAQYEALMGSGLYKTLTDKKLLVPHSEADEEGLDGGAFLVLEPERIPLISYPYEWCFGQLKDAALTTLRIHKLALEKDMILKDASAYNIQFTRGRAALIDTLSFDFYREGEPWAAYGQFCRHFLAPLFLTAYTDIRLSQLLRVYIDGIPLDLASGLLRGKGGFAVRAHIHWHARSVKNHARAGKSGEAPPRVLKVSKFNMSAMIDSMIKIIEKLKLPGIQTEWGDYYSRTNYSEEAADEKKRTVAEYLGAVSPAVTWDFGANDGTYSRLALLGGGCFAAAFDIDPIAVERNYTQVKRSGENMLPLLLDLTNPSPAIGFGNAERGSLDMRQTPDCVLMLAVIHHLAISNNLPFKIIAEWLGSVCRSLIIEFVPKTDSQTQILLANRDDIFPDYTEEGFEAAFGEYFVIAKKHALSENGRVIYLMEKKGGKNI